jgi:parallel beta-helix repeat protein
MNDDSLEDNGEMTMLDGSALDADFINRTQTEEEIDEEDKKVIKIKLTVDPESGAHKTIEEAIDLVPKDRSTPTTIKISSGLYKENLKIMNKSVILKCKDSNSEVYISGEEGPTILIDNDPDHIVELYGLKVSFKGKLNNHNGKGTGRKTDEENSQEYATKGIAAHSNNLSMLSLDDSTEVPTLSDCYKRFRGLKYTETSDCIVMLKRGRLVMHNCNIDLSMMTKHFQGELVNIATMEDTILEMNKCEVKGKIEANCLGMFINRGNSLLDEVLFRDFKKGALVINTKRDNRNTVKSCTITFNKTLGLLLMGCNDKSTVINSTIQKNECPGIQVLPAHNCTIKHNLIRINTHGIKVRSADPVISGNKISDNYRTGIITSSVTVKSNKNQRVRGKEFEYLELRPSILQNKISDNKEHGIYVFGQQNSTRIERNLICKNQWCGVKAQSDASPVIRSNNITRNGTQGILLVESSWGTIINNDVSESAKANIALGGVESTNSYISSNRVHSGSSEGIFIVKSGRVIVRNNRVWNNKHGIILADSFAELNSNQIFSNIRHGVFLLLNSQPILKSNTIEENGGSGVYIKGRGDLAQNLIENTFRKNDTGVYFERKSLAMKDIQKKNTFVDNTVVSPSINCTLI